MKKLFVVALAAAMLVAFAATAFAFETSFGGRVRTNFGYIYTSEERTDNGSDSTIRGFFSVSGSSYFRATFTSKDKKVGVRLEMGMGSTMTRRTVFGWYTIGNCKLVAGNNYTWAGDGVIGHSSWLTDLTGGGMGLNYFGRMPMIALEWREGNFGVQVGIFAPTDNGDSIGSPDDFGWYLPQLHITGDLKFAMFQMAPAVAIVNYQWESSNDTSYTAWFIGLPVRGTFGPVTVTANLFYSQNGADDFGSNALNAPVLEADGTVEDSTSYGGFLEVAYKAGPMKIAGGFGGMRVQNDAWRRGAIGWSDDSTTQWKAYLTMSYKLHANLSLLPEIGYANYGDSPVTGYDAGQDWLFGLRFQFIF